MNQVEEVVPTTAPVTTVEIKDLDTFARSLAHWHDNKVKVLEHMLSLPSGTEMIVDGNTEAPVIMAGDMLAGFKAGIDLALMELGTLPFVFETEPPVESPPAVPA